MSTSHDQAGHWIRNNPRKTGSACLLLGSFVLNQYILEPMRHATEGAGSVSLSLKMCTLGILFVVFGLALVLGGAPVAAIVRPAPGDSRVAAFMLGGVIAVLGFGVFLQLKSHLQSLGYVFDRSAPSASTISPPGFSPASASTPPSSASWTVATAQKEAVRRYPQLGVANSPLNRAFLARYQQIKANDPSSLRDPSWPLHLADEVAQQPHRQ